MKNTVLLPRQRSQQQTNKSVLTKYVLVILLCLCIIAQFRFMISSSSSSSSFSKDTTATASVTATEQEEAMMRPNGASSTMDWMRSLNLTTTLTTASTTHDTNHNQQLETTPSLLSSMSSVAASSHVTRSSRSNLAHSDIIITNNKIQNSGIDMSNKKQQQGSDNYIDGNDNNLTNVNLTTAPVFDEYCQNLVQQHGFWDQRQCDLWRDVVEGNKSIDMTPFLADNIPEKNRWWPSTTKLYPPGSIELTVPAGRGAGARVAQQLNPKTTSSSARGRIIYHLHIHKSGGTFFCGIFQKAKIKRDFIRVIDENGHNVATMIPKYEMAVRRALARIQLANPHNNCNNPDNFWKDPMNQTMYKYKSLLKKNSQLNSATSNNHVGADVGSREDHELEEAQEYARPYPGGIQGMARIHDQFGKSGWHQFAPYLGDTRSTMRDIYQRITGGRSTTTTTNSKGRRRPTVAHNIQWVYVANEGSLELEPIFGHEGPYFYSILLRDPIDWIVSMFHYDVLYLKSAKDRKKANMERYLRNVIWKGTWGGPQFLTRRICGVGCMFDGNDGHGDPSYENFLRAKSFLEHFDLVWTLKDTNKLLKEGHLGRIFPALQFEHEQTAKNVTASTQEVPNLASWARSSTKRTTTTITKRTSETNPPKRPAELRISQIELDLIRKYTWMDKVLYEFGKMLMEKKYKKSFEATH
jgi:hypothetical protein